AIRDRKSGELEAVFGCCLGFAHEVEVGLFVSLEDRDHSIDTGVAPCFDVLGDPVTTAWPQRDTEPPSPRSGYPEDFRSHEAQFSSASASGFLEVRRRCLLRVRAKP